MARRMPEAVLVAILAIVGVLNLLPVLGLLGTGQLESLYGITGLDSTELLLMRHRALLLALLGGLLILSIWVVPMRLPVIVAAVLSKVIFVGLVLTSPHTPAVARVAVIDVIAIVLLAVALWLSLAPRARVRR